MNARLLKIINTVKKNNDQQSVEKINKEDDLRNDLGFGSLDLAELTVRIESEFGVDIFADGLINTIGEVQEKIQNA